MPESGGIYDIKKNVYWVLTLHQNQFGRPWGWRESIPFQALTTLIFLPVVTLYKFVRGGPKTLLTFDLAHDHNLKNFMNMILPRKLTYPPKTLVGRFFSFQHGPVSRGIFLRGGGGGQMMCVLFWFCFNNGVSAPNGETFPLILQ